MKKNVFFNETSCHFLILLSFAKGCIIVTIVSA
jgi:hypothetical protein